MRAPEIFEAEFVLPDEISDDGWESVVGEESEALDWDDPQVRAATELIGAYIGADVYDDPDEGDAEAMALRELVGCNEPQIGAYVGDIADFDVGFGVPKFIKKTVKVVKRGAGVALKGHKLALSGARKVRDSAKTIVRSPYLKYAAIGVTFVNPAVGASMMGGIVAAEKIIAATEAAEGASKQVKKKAKQARALIARTKKAAARGDKRAQGGLKLLKLAELRRRVGPKKWKRFLVAATLKKRARIAAAKKRRLAVLRKRSRRSVRKPDRRSKAERHAAAREWIKKTRQKRRAAAKRKPTTAGFLVSHSGKITPGRWSKA